MTRQVLHDLAFGCYLDRFLAVLRRLRLGVLRLCVPMTLRRHKPLNPGTPLRRTGFTPAQRATSLTRTAMKAKRPKVTPEERRARKLLAARSNGICEVCGQHRAENAHHRRKAGRVWAVENLIHVCGMGNLRGCHAAIELQPAASQAAGLIVLSGQDPATTPVYLLAHGLVLLTSEGGFTRVEKEAA